MKRFVRFLVAWLLLLALPLQGYAAVRMSVCETAPAVAPSPAAMPHGAAGHDHAAMLQAQADAQHDAHDEGDGEHGTKPGSCASCCIGAALAPAPAVPLSLERPVSLPIPFRAGHLPSVDPVLPERPPQPALA